MLRFNTLSAEETGIKVVVVDAQPMQNDSICQLVANEADISAIAVPDIDSALSESRPDAVVIDLGSLSSGGVEGLRRLRRSLNDAAVVLAIIGENDTALGLQAIRANAQDCIIRDTLEAPALVRILRHAIEKHRLQSGMTELIETSPDAMLVIDESGSIVYVNPACKDTLDLGRDELLGTHFGQPVVSGSSVDVEVGDGRHAQMRVVATRWAGAPANLVSFRDVTRKKQLEKDVWVQANFDELTKLPNRALFIDRLDKAIAGSKRTNDGLGLMFIDLDRLKWVNDSYGHAAGDEVLKTTANRLQSCLRESDTVARLGGDEFVILLSNIRGSTGTERVARKVLEEISRPFVSKGKHELTVSASVGIALCPDNARDVYGLLNCADTAMYQAKAQGRNGFAFYSREMHDTALSHMSLEQDLRFAIAHDRIDIHYQPVVDLETGLITDVEALLRWSHPRRGLLDSRTVVEIASHSRLLADLDDWVLKHCAAQARQWKEKLSSPPRIWVNLASDRRKDAGFEDVLDAMLIDQGFSLADSPLGVEMTERCRIDESRETHDLLSRMSQRGVKLAIDDFLVASSSISHLRNLPFDVVKIDRDAIRSIADNVDDRSLVVSLIDMAHRLNLKIVAEGIETRQQLQILRHAGCDAGQGFFFAKALPADDLQQLLGRPDGLVQRLTA